VKPAAATRADKCDRPGRTTLRVEVLLTYPALLKGGWESASRAVQVPGAIPLLSRGLPPMAGLVAACAGEDSAPSLVRGYMIHTRSLGSTQDIRTTFIPQIAGRLVRSVCQLEASTGHGGRGA
jgi:hypothetical protein